MAIIAKLTLVSVSIDPHIVKKANNVEETGNLIKSSDAILEVVIHLGSLCSIIIPDTFLSAGISIANPIANEQIYHVDIGTFQDNQTVFADSCIYHIIYKLLLF